MDQSGRSAFSDSSGFPVALAFLVIPAFRRFQLSGHYFNCLVATNNSLRVAYCQRYCLILLVLFDWGETEIGLVQENDNAKNPRSPRSQTRSKQVPSSLPTLFLNTIYSAKCSPLVAPWFPEFSDLGPGDPYVCRGCVQVMDEWTIKTPNPLCRLFFKIDLLAEFAALCLTDFIDWRYIHLWLVFLTQFVDCCPLGRRNYTCVLFTFSLNWGGGGGGGVFTFFNFG